MIEAETAALLQALESDKKKLEKKKKLVASRVEALQTRVDAYKKLAKDGAVAHQKLLDVQWEFQEAVMSHDQVNQSIAELPGKAAKIKEDKKNRLLQEKFKEESAKRNLSILKERLHEAHHVHSSVSGIVLSERFR